MAENICSKCNEEPIYQYRDKESKLCAKCFLDAMAEFLSGPCMGDKSTCKMCNKEIEYVGPHWRHTTYSPRHIAEPKTTWAEKEGKGLILWLRGE